MSKNQGRGRNRPLHYYPSHIALHTSRNNYTIIYFRRKSLVKNTFPSFLRVSRLSVIAFFAAADVLRAKIPSPIRRLALPRFCLLPFRWGNLPVLPGNLPDGTLEPFQKFCGHVERGFLAFGEN
jgi:hypothetical protein